ncbi:hypothetical protein D7Y13_11580 [Corallococcus praedator]|uniref:Uncharacterized protein n=1 Tax=Corallococcus praedator TaxID=2316724 RepID=A0ABX9QME3_9BACT|nr:hypothetical protein D7X75_11660 [Corallococcus sp. CA031C]RKI11054.1 hypothetical protein D7Y13_11580 [Corallococcus praedator]
MRELRTAPETLAQRGSFPQAGEEEVRVAPQAAAPKEPMRQRTPRVGWAEPMTREPRPGVSPRRAAAPAGVSSAPARALHAGCRPVGPRSCSAPVRP